MRKSFAARPLRKKERSGRDAWILAARASFWGELGVNLWSVAGFVYLGTQHGPFQVAI